jgi:Cupin
LQELLGEGLFRFLAGYFLLNYNFDVTLLPVVVSMKVSTLLKLAALFNTIYAVDVTVNPALDASLKTAATQLDRLALLPSNSDWLFDFTAQPSYTYSPGSVVNADAATFPATVGNGMTMALLSLGPCAMLPPHYHPRATNFVVAVEGTTNTYMIEENGARLVSETLTPGKMTIFPAASLHTMQNTGIFLSFSWGNQLLT